MLSVSLSHILSYVCVCICVGWIFFSLTDSRCVCNDQWNEHNSHWLNVVHCKLNMQTVIIELHIVNREQMYIYTHIINGQIFMVIIANQIEISYVGLPMNLWFWFLVLVGRLNIAWIILPNWSYKVYLNYATDKIYIIFDIPVSA